MEALAAQLGADAIVVIDPAVPDEPQVARAVAHRLTAVLEIHDRESPVPEPRVSDLSRSLSVGPSVGQPREHALAELGVKRAVCSDDP